jgi:hypothetical protein
MWSAVITNVVSADPFPLWPWTKQQTLGLIPSLSDPESSSKHRDWSLPSLALNQAANIGTDFFHLCPWIKQQTSGLIPSLSGPEPSSKHQDWSLPLWPWTKQQTSGLIPSLSGPEPSSNQAANIRTAPFSFWGLKGCDNGDNVSQWLYCFTMTTMFHNDNNNNDNVS